MAKHDLVQFGRSFSEPFGHGGRFGRSLMSLQDDMNRLFHDFLGEGPLAGWSEKFESWPALDISDNDKSLKIRAELSGMDPEKVDVSVTDGILTIKGERQEEKEEKEENYLCREISFGSFQRTVSLPEGVDTEKAEATFKNGILKINFPKKENAGKIAKKLKIHKAA